MTKILIILALLMLSVQAKPILSEAYVHTDDLVGKVEDNSGSPEILYYHSDRQFNVRGLSNSTGNIIELYAYSVYGQQTVMDDTGSVIGVTAENNSYGFTGRYLDNETGLWYFRARYFNDEMGRFINRDPLGYVDGMSLYNGYFAERFGLDPYGLMIGEIQTGRVIGNTQKKWITFMEEDECKKGNENKKSTGNDNEYCSFTVTVSWTEHFDAKGKLKHRSNLEIQFSKFDSDCCRADIGVTQGKKVLDIDGVDYSKWPGMRIHGRENDPNALLITLRPDNQGIDESDGGWHLEREGKFKKLDMDVTHVTLCGNKETGTIHMKLNLK